MDAHKSKISDIFNMSRLLEVPFYQRSYVWGKEQWDRFLEDLKYTSENQESYFLGALILKQRPTTTSSVVGDIRVIIDGQQRLTTLCIFFKALYLKLGKNNSFAIRFLLEDGTPAISHSRLDSAAFNQVMELSNETILPGESQILKAYNYFKENINPEDFNINVLMNCLNFVVIDLDEKDDEQQIFDTINSLGVRLTTGELLKNYFFQRENYDHYEKDWKPVFESDDECIHFWSKGVTAGRIKKANVESFLYAYLQVRMHDPALGVTSADKLIFRRTDGLFNNFKKFEGYIGRDTLIKDIAEYAKLYKEYLNPAIDEVTISGAPSLERINFMIYNLDVATMIPFVLYVLKNVSDENERNKMFDYLESYIMRRLVCNSKTGNYSDFFTENMIGQEILTVQSLKEYVESKDPTASLAMPSDTAVKDGFMNTKMNNRRARGILYMLESRIRSNAMMATELLPFDRYTLEHLLPQKWTMEKWPMVDGFSMEERNLRLMTMGNFAILPQPLNTSISNDSWTNKLNGNTKNKGLREYATGLLTLQDYLACPKWDEIEINKRAEHLAEVANKVWKEK